MSQFGDYGNNPYYANGGAGGFIAGGSPFGGSTQGSPGGSVRKAASSSLRPLTVKQAVNATQSHADAEFYVDSVELGQLTVVAQVISITTKTTNNVYWLDDGTGRIEARHWMDSSNEEDTDKWGGISENIYVRVTGVLKTFANKRHINATHIRPISDPHEIYFHLMEAMFVTLAHARGHPSKPGDQSVDRVRGNDTASSAYTSPATGKISNDEYAHLPPLERKMIDFIIAQPPNPDGVNIAAIARAMHADGKAIGDAIDKLMDEGHIFTTIDESHFSVAN